jgi:CRP/FNR family transcriptional regulator
MRKMHEVASHELAIAQEHMVVLGRRRAEERVASFLLKWWQRLKRIQGPSPTVPLPMGRQDIADHLGLTIETVSRTLARWMRERIILDVPDGVRILDGARLEEILGN